MRDMNNIYLKYNQLNNTLLFTQFPVDNLPSSNRRDGSGLTPTTGAPAWCVGVRASAHMDGRPTANGINVATRATTDHFHFHAEPVELAFIELTSTTQAISDKSRKAVANSEA